MDQKNSIYTLSNGVRIPAVGFGTWQAPEGDVAYASVKHAISCGYRHIDTAQGYGNEASVGKAIRESGVPRERGSHFYGFSKTIRTCYSKSGKNMLQSTFGEF